MADQSAGSGGSGSGNKVSKIEDGRRAATEGVSLKPSRQEGKIPTSYFIVPAQDSKGHSARIGSRVPPGMFHEIDILIHTKQFPWGTSSDFLRWALRLGLDEAGSYVESGRLSNLRAQSHALLVVCREEEDNLEFANIIDRASRSVSVLQGSGAEGPARKVVQKILAEVDKMDDPFWRNKYREELERRFAHLLEGAPSLAPQPGQKK